MGWFDFLKTTPSRVPSSVPAPDRPRERELELFKHDMCGYCVRVMRTIDRLGLPVNYRDVRADTANRRALQALTGRNQVPCLVIDGQPLLESADIVAWLEAYATRSA